MVQFSRRELLGASGLFAATILGGARPASAAGSRVSSAESAASRAAQPAPPKVEAFGLTPERAAVVAHLDGELWAFHDGDVGVQRSAGGVAVASVAVQRAARSDITISIPGHDDFTVSVDTSPAALRESLLRIVNKRIALGRDDEPKKFVAAHGVMIDERIKGQLDAMFVRASKDRIALEAISAYRAFDAQKKLYDEYAKRDGARAADTYSARPGHSEHQLGLAIDLRGADGQHELTPEFKGTQAGKWIAAHAHEFGFVVRYPENQKKVTGYEPEPWHVRYVGPDVARFLHERRDILTLEELFGLPDAPDY